MGRGKKLFIRIIAVVMTITVLIGVLYGIYELLENAAGEKYYINMDDISNIPITEGKLD